MALLEASRRGNELVLRTGLVLTSLLALLVGPGLVVIDSVGAAEPPPEKIFDFCPDGMGSGQCINARGVAANPNTGHIYVSELGNRRISEFNALGQFIRAWGFGVADGVSNEFQTCTETCFAGQTSAERGAFNEPNGIAVDAAGDLYVDDVVNLRVQKFDAKGNFLLMFGGEVNETSGGNVCPRPGFPTDVCKAGTGGSGEGQFAAGWEARSNISIDSAGTIYVGDLNRIQEFDSGGNFAGQISLPGEGFVVALAVDDDGTIYYISETTPSGVERVGDSPLAVGIPAGAIAVDPEDNLYVYANNPGVLTDEVIKFNPANGEELTRFGKGDFTGSTALGTNLCPGSEPPGNVYAANFTPGSGFVRAYGTEPIGCFKARTLPATKVEETTATLNGSVNPSGLPVSECRFEYGTGTAYGQIAPCVPSAGELGEGSEPVPVHADLSGLDAGTVHHFRLLAKVGGETEIGADEEFKTKGPPVISDEHVVGATSDEATLRALINPEGFATTYHCEYGLDATYGQSTPVIAVGSGLGDKAALCNLEGLSPGTTYHWRFVATNSSDATASEDHTLITYSLAETSKSCSNDSLRSGSSAFLPDCRAYEMVSPVEKNGGDIYSLAEEYVQVAPGGNSLTYTTIPSFAGQPNAFTQNQYLATRGGGGWTNEGIHPPVAGSTATGFLMGISREFMAFTPDLCNAWLIDPQTPAPTADGQVGEVNLYRRDNCAPGVGALEALTPAPPALPGNINENYVENNSMGGVSEDGRHAVFVAAAKLNEDASAALKPSNGFPVDQVYDRFEGDLSLVSVLPDGTGGDPSPGNGQGFADPGVSGVGSGWAKNLEGAVSADGSRVYWTSGFQINSGEGKIYLRRHPEQGIVADECSEESIACTIAVSPGNAFFWSATSDGSKALFSEEGLLGRENLFVFDLAKAQAEEPPREQIAKDIEGVLGWSEDLSRVYFTSEAALAGAAVAGEPNLYLSEGGEFSFVATLVDGDVGAKEPGGEIVPYDLGNRAGEFRATRTSADGTRLAFESRARLTEFDNTTTGGKPAVEVYLYDAEAGELHCASCNPSGARPATRELKQSNNRDFPHSTNVFAAAWIPTRHQPLHASNALSADGKRLFFNSNDALLPRDVNGAQDVYEWEAPGVGSCKEASPSYFPQNGGCLHLISTGESTHESEFREASPDGEDVFFVTNTSLLPQDPGLIDLYDARVGGGYPRPVQKSECEGEACQSPPPPPQFPAPASGAFRGPGNPKPGKCPKGKRRVSKGGKTRCVKKKRGNKKGKARQGRADGKRRAAR